MRLAILLLLASGALGLGYQVLWVRTVLHFTGVAAHAWAVVLASFMAGLAIGARVFGARADRMRRPLALYGWLELGVGAYAIVYLPLAELVSRAHHALVTSSTGGAAALAIEALAAGVLLLPPTILLGGTWPAMLRHVTRHREAAGRSAAALYGANAAGAVIGALAMAYWLLPALGIRGALMLLAACNAVVALVALALARDAPSPAREDENESTERERDSPEGERESTGRERESTERERPQVDAGLAVPEADAGAPAESAEGQAPALGVRATGLVLFALGFASFSFEIAWTRFFGLALGSSTYSFALVVATFVAAIAVGGLLLARFDARTRRPLVLLGACQLGAAAAVLIPLPVMERLPWLFLRLDALLRGAAPDHVFAATELAKALTCAVVMALPALFLGLAIPLAVKAHARRLSDLGRSAGRLYAANTWGNVLGALTAGLVLLPLLGADGLLALGAVALAALGGMTLLRVAPSWRSGRRAAALAGLAVVLAVLAAFGARWDPRWFTLVPARGGDLTYGAARERIERWEVVFEADDPATHVLVTRAERPGRDVHQVLFVSGKPDASNAGDMPTQLLLAHVPLSLHPDPDEVLVIGLASGVTAGAALAHDVEEVEVVELARAMEGACRTFRPWNFAPLDDPRLRLVIDDARSHLLHSERTWDVIISEPSNPWVSGVGSLFSAELYASARERLAEGGLYLQWLQAYELSDVTFATIVRTFRGAFPHVVGFVGQGSDLLLVGSAEPIAPDPAAIARRIGQPAVAGQLASIRIDSVEDLLSRQVLSQPSIDWIAAAVPFENTDDNLFLEYEAPRDLAWRATPTFHSRLDETRAPTSTLLAASLARPRCPSAEAVTFAPSAEPEEALARLREVWREDPPAPRAELRSTLLRWSACEAETAWVDQVLDWPLSESPEVATRQRSLRLALLMAAERPGAARRELVAWNRSDVPVFAEEILLAACRVGPEQLCLDVARAVAGSASGSSDGEHVERFVALRNSGP